MSSTRAAIYYPYVQPPLGWLKQALLYWDQVSSIVGDHFHPDRDIDWLMDQGLFMPLRNRDLPRHAQEQVRQEVVSHLIWAEGNGVQLDSESEIGNLDLLIRGKLPLGLEEEIRRRRLIHGSQERIPINSYLLELLLSIMARHLAASLTDSHTHYTMHTTEQKYVRLGLDPFVGTSAAPGYNLILRDFLPIPDASTSLEQIIDFKESHRVELLQFRRALDSLYARILNEVPLDAVLPAMHEEMEIALHDIRQGLRRSSIRSSLGSLSVLLLGGLSLSSAQEGLGQTQVPWIFDGLGTTVLAALVGAWLATRNRRGNSGDFGYLHRTAERFSSS